MLGRGLEALIPPQQPGQNGNPIQAHEAAPQGQVHTGYPYNALPAEPEEQLLAAPPIAVPLMLHVHDDDEQPQGHRVFDARETYHAPQVSPEPAVEATTEPYSQPTFDRTYAPQQAPLQPQRFEPTPPVLSSAPVVPDRRGGEAVFQIEIDRIVANPNQPRRHFDDEALRDLAASIREFGILQPIVVRKLELETDNGTNVQYEIIAGERRWRASKLVGLPRVPAIIRQVDVKRESLELAIIENLQREQLNPVEMARAYARLQDEFGMTQREVATRLGKSREVVANTLRLLDLSSEVQTAIEDGRISESHGRLLLGVTDPALQQSLFKDLLERQLTTRELRERVSGAARGGRKAPRAERLPEQLTPELAALQDKLSAELGAPVKIQTSGGVGKITISFYSPEELSAILEHLAREADILL